MFLAVILPGAQHGTSRYVLCKSSAGEIYWTAENGPSGLALRRLGLDAGANVVSDGQATNEVVEVLFCEVKEKCERGMARSGLQ